MGDDVWAVLLFVGCIGVSVWAGYGSGRSGIADDCRTFSAFKVGDKVFSCKLLEKQP